MITAKLKDSELQRDSKDLRIFQCMSLRKFHQQIHL